MGRSHECDWPGVAHLPAVTSSRVGDSVDVSEIDAVMSASVAAVAELAQLGPALALPLLEFGLSVYQLKVGGGGWHASHGCCPWVPIRHAHG